MLRHPRYLTRPKPFSQWKTMKWMSFFPTRSLSRESDWSLECPVLWPALPCAPPSGGPRRDKWSVWCQPSIRHTRLLPCRRKPTKCPTATIYAPSREEVLSIYRSYYKRNIVKALALPICISLVICVVVSYIYSFLPHFELCSNFTYLYTVNITW